MWRKDCAYFALGLVSAAAYAAAPRYVAARDILLEYETAGDTRVDAAELWVSVDGRRTWQQVSEVPPGRRALQYRAPGDGTYDFYVVLKNDRGVSGAPPEPGAAASATVIVDTLAPLLQIHRVRAQLRQATDVDAGPRPIDLDLTLVEEHMSALGLRAFYRPVATENWQDGGTVDFSGELGRWKPPAGLHGHFDLRLVATDLAGNHAQDELLGLELPTAEATTQPAETKPAAVPPPPPEYSDSNLPPRDLHATAEAQRLRGLAEAYAHDGQLSLAAARYEDAVAAQPQSADLLASLGQIRFRLGAYDEAETRFRAALDIAPEHLAALDGLALVAATQKRYPQALELLIRLQKLQPAAGSVWLRSGDVEHRLGNLAQALADWKRACDRAGDDQDLRAKAQRRLDYFGSETRPPGPASTTKPTWPKPPSPRPSSSSTETKSIKNPSP